MNLSFVWMGVGSLCVCLYLAFGLWQNGQTRSHDLQDLSRQIVVTKLKVEEISDLPLTPLKGIESSYQHLYETMRASAHLADAKFMIELSNAKDSAQVAQALMPSRFVGVDALSLKVSFSDVSAPEGYIKILKTLGDLQKTLPIEIKKIDAFDKNIEMAVDLFGSPRRV